MGQRLVDLRTLVAAPMAPTPVLPHPPLDSAANDINGGEYIPPFDGAQPAPDVPLDLEEQTAPEPGAAAIPPTIDVQRSPAMTAPVAPEVDESDEDALAAVDIPRAMKPAPAAPTPPAPMRKPQQVQQHQHGRRR